VSHRFIASSAVFDDDHLVSCAGLVPVMALAERCGLPALLREHVKIVAKGGANAAVKILAIVAGMACGADSIADLDLLRHGGMPRLFDGVRAPSTLGSFVRLFTFGHVRQLDAVASRFLLALAGLTRLLRTRPRSSAGRGPARGGPAGWVFVDVDDTVIEVHGHGKQGAGFGYNKVRGLNALLATVSTARTAPVIVAQRLRRGACSSPRGGKRLIGDAVKTTRRLLDATVPVLVRMDSAFYGRNAVHAALAGGAQVSVTIRMDQPGSRLRSRASVKPRGPRSSTPTQSSTRPPGSGSPGPRSPRSPSPHSPPRPQPIRCPVG